MEKEKKIKKSEVLKNIFLLEFETQLDLTSTFLRFQEHYESPEFRGKIFSLDEYKDWYTKLKGSFTYYSDWSGFNIPSYVLKPFYENKFDPLTTEEQSLLSLFKEHEHPFYVLGIYDKHDGTQNILYLEHETAHGLFYTEPVYREKVLKILEKYNLDDLKDWLRSRGGYHEEVLLDECHAYSLTGSKKLTVEIDESMKQELRNVFEEYSNKKL
ncbi:MAG: hypothetical protein AB200_01345 [Parcubacteria bacterium C7867-005]|nr:MAG: hypothetical protein AB200_01345 [Parcubacteria bacterium C7867-005]